MNRICERELFRLRHRAGLVILGLGLMHAMGVRLTAADRPTIGEIERLDPALDALVPADAKMEIIVDGLDWCEGPLWIPADGGFLIFSDIPPNKIYRWDAKSGKQRVLVSVGLHGHDAARRRGRHERLDARSRRPADSLSAWRPPRRPDERAARQAGAEVRDGRRRVRRQTVQQPERRHASLQRRDLLHRSALWPRSLPRRRLEDPRQGAAVPGRLSRDARRHGDAADEGTRTAQRDRALAGRKDAVRGQLARSAADLDGVSGARRRHDRRGQSVFRCDGTREDPTRVRPTAWKSTSTAICLQPDPAAY